MEQVCKPLKRLRLRLNQKKPELQMVVLRSIQLPGTGEEETQQSLTEWKSGIPEFAPKGDWRWNTLN